MMAHIESWFYKLLHDFNISRAKKKIVPSLAYQHDRWDECGKPNAININKGISLW